MCAAELGVRSSSLPATCIRVLLARVCQLDATWPSLVVLHDPRSLNADLVATGGLPFRLRPLHIHQTLLRWRIASADVDVRRHRGRYLPRHHSFFCLLPSCRAANYRFCMCVKRPWWPAIFGCVDPAQVGAWSDIVARTVPTSFASCAPQTSTMPSLYFSLWSYPFPLPRPLKCKRPKRPITGMHRCGPI